MIFHSLHIVIPIKNESDNVDEFILYLQHQLPLLKNKNLQMTIVDDHSKDQGFARIKNHFTNEKSISFLTNYDTGIYQGLMTALDFSDETSDRWIMLLPLDCRIDLLCLMNEIKKTNTRDHLIYGLSKAYLSYNYLMKVYAYLQNIILFKLFGIAVWTNGLIMHQKTLKSIILKNNQKYFLSDLALVKEFNEISNKKIGFLKQPTIFVSPRKYKKDGLAFRIILNGLILIIYKSRLLPAHKLSKIYQFNLNRFFFRNKH